MCGVEVTLGMCASTVLVHYVVSPSFFIIPHPHAFDLPSFASMGIVLGVDVAHHCNAEAMMCVCLHGYGGGNLEGT